MNFMFDMTASDHECNDAVSRASKLIAESTLLRNRSAEIRREATELRNQAQASRIDRQVHAFAAGR